MARVKNPLNSAEASGLVGGLEYRTTRNGAVVGNRSISPQRITLARSRTRYWLKLAHTTWAAMTAKQQSGWQRVCGDPRDARQYWIGAFLRLKPYGITLPSTCPAARPPFVWTWPTFGAWSASQWRCTLTWSSNGDTRFALLIAHLASFRRLSNPDLAKFKCILSRAASQPTGLITLPHLAPYVLFRAQIVDVGTGALLGTHIIDGEPTWDAGPGDLMGMAPDLPDDISGPPPEDEPA